MTTAAVPAAHDLAWYVRQLVERLSEGEPAALSRLRTVVGLRRAAIGLEEETVTARFVASCAFEVVPVREDEGVDVDGTGRTRHDVVLALLAGDLDATDALLDGLIEVQGPLDAVTAMLIAIEILLDASTRVPPLRRLADLYVREHDDPANRWREGRLRRRPERELDWATGLERDEP
jgi:hypothetical protein